MNNKFKILSVFIILILGLMIFDNINYKNYYNSFSDKKEAQKIQKKLETIAHIVQKTDETKYININSLTTKEIKRVCIISPFFPEADKFINVPWKNIENWENWEKNIINQEEIYSVFFIEKDNVIPIKILTYKLKPTKAICKDGEAIFKIYKKDSYSYLDIE